MTSSYFWFTKDSWISSLEKPIVTIMSRNKEKEKSDRMYILAFTAVFFHLENSQCNSTNSTLANRSYDCYSANTVHSLTTADKENTTSITKSLSFCLLNSAIWFVLYCGCRCMSSLSQQQLWGKHCNEISHLNKKTFHLYDKYLKCC